ncbi:MAG: PAS domain-containing protein [Ilumatobacteraceae bacterium]
MNANRIDDDRSALETLDALLAVATTTLPSARGLILELRKRFEKARLIAEYSSDVVALGTPDGRLEWISESVTRTFGWQPADVIDRPFLDFIHVDDHERVLQARSQLAQGETAMVTVRFRTPTSEYRWISMRVAALTDDDGKITTRVGGWRDITDQVITSQSLELSRLRLRRVFETMFDPIAMLAPLRDTDGHVIDFLYTDANPAACDYNKVPYEDLIGMRLLDLFPRMRTSGIFERCVEVIETGEPFVVDGFRYRNDRLNMERSYEMRIVKVGDEISYTWRDVTNRQDQMIRRVDEIVAAPIIDATSRLTEALGTASAAERAHIIDALRQHEFALRRLHTVVDELRPTTVAHTDLGAMLRAVLFGVSARSGVPGELHVDDGGGALDDPLIEAHLLLVARLALNAMVSECRATALHVELRCDDSAIELRITAPVDTSSPDPAGLDDAVAHGRALGAFCAAHTRQHEVELVLRVRPDALAGQSSAGPTLPR